MPHIKFYIDPRIVEPILIEEGTTIGRSEEAQIVILDYTIDPIHARFLKSEDGFILENLSSKPFLVNGTEIFEQVRLQQEDEIQFGNKRMLYSNYDYFWPPDVFLVDLVLKSGDDYPLEMLVSKPEILFRCLTEDNVIQKIQQTIPEILTEREVDPLIVMNLETVLHEAMNNAARHGHQYQRNKVIHLYYKITTEEVRITILDEGIGFDYAYTLDQAEGADAVNAARARYKSGGYGGLGFIMMLKCLSGIEFNTQGNWVTLIKKLES